MLKINTISIHGNTYECSKVNLIIGANNSGKSTLLRILYHGLANHFTQDTEPLVNINLSMGEAKKLITSLFPDINNAASIRDLPSLGLKTTKIQNTQNIPWDEQMLNTMKGVTDDETSFRSATLQVV